MLCSPWVSRERNIPWLAPGPEKPGPRESRAIHKRCLGQRSESRKGLRKNNDCKCLYINLEFTPQVPAALLSLSCPMRSMALLGGEGEFFFIDGEMDIQPVCTRSRERTLLNVNEKVRDWGSLMIHFTYHKPELLE